MSRVTRWIWDGLPTAVFLISLIAQPALAQEKRSEGGSFYQTYQRRSAQRFDILSYLADQRRIRSEQDARYGYSKGGSSFESDIVLTYWQPKGEIERSSKLGDLSEQGGRVQFLLNGLFSEGNKRRLINIDLGFEGFYRATGDYLAAPGAQTEWSVKESGGGLLIRPFGRSSQDTGLLLKGGYSSLSTRGLWDTSGAPATTRSLSAPYWGAEAKLYLLPILGARAEYTATSPQKNDELAGSWSTTRVTYGAFLELFVVSVEAQIFDTRYLLKPSAAGSVETRDSFHGVGLLASLYF